MMSVIVKDKNTHKNYILLGTGFRVYKAVRPSFIGGNLFPHEEEGTIATVAVCDFKGDIIWIDSNDLQVVEIDGVKISEINLFELDRIKEELDKSEKVLNVCEFCPMCKTKINKNDQYCPGCGFKLID